MKVLEPILALRSDDIVWLGRALRHHYTGMEVRGVIEAADKGEVKLWRLSPGIIVTRVLSHPRGLEVRVESMAGLKVPMADVAEDLKDYAKSLGAKWVGAENAHPALNPRYQRLTGARPVATLMLMEV